MALNHLWSMINGLQLSTHLPLFNLQFPANASFLVNFIIKIATFDILPIEAIWAIFDFPQKGAYSLSFQSTGYEYIYLIENMGTCFFLVQIFLTACLITALLALIAKYTNNEKVANQHKKMKSQLYWGVPLRFLFEAYLELLICVTIGLLNLEWK